MPQNGGILNILGSELTNVPYVPHKLRDRPFITCNFPIRSFYFWGIEIVKTGSIREIVWNNWNMKLKSPFYCSTSKYRLGTLEQIGLRYGTTLCSEEAPTFSNLVAKPCGKLSRLSASDGRYWNKLPTTLRSGY